MIVRLVRLALDAPWVLASDGEPGEQAGERGKRSLVQLALGLGKIEVIMLFRLIKNKGRT
jgi:hypothetical protein